MDFRIIREDDKEAYTTDYWGDLNMNLFPFVFGVGRLLFEDSNSTITTTVFHSS